jgi:hypothetical protein
MTRLRIDEVSRGAFLMDLACYSSGGGHIPEGVSIYRLMNAKGGQIGYVDNIMLQALLARGYSFPFRGTTTCPFCTNKTPVSDSMTQWRKHFEAFRKTYLAEAEIKAKKPEEGFSRD